QYVPQTTPYVPQSQTTPSVDGQYSPTAIATSAVQPPPGWAPPTAASPTSNALEAQSLQVLPSEPKEFADGKVVATVGNMPILAEDVGAMTPTAIHNKMIPAPPPEHEEEFYAMAMRPILAQMVKMKLVVNDAKQTVPAAGMQKIEIELRN